MSEDDLRPYPKPARRGPERPTPEVEVLADRLKAVRNQKADELGLPRGTLLANAAVLAIATAAPTSREDLAAVPGMRPWKLEALGDDFLAAIRGAT
jgi:ribonuclease D